VAGLVAATAWGGEPAQVSPWFFGVDRGLFHSRMADAEGAERERAAGPFWERSDSPDGPTLRAVPRPIYVRVTDPATARTAWDALWPVAAGKTFGEQESWRVVSAFFLNQDRGDPESKYRFWLLPVWFHGRDESGVGYAALFPVGGHIRNLLWKDQIRFVLWPVWARSGVNDVVTTDVFWPIYSRTTTPDGRLEKFRVFPLYGHSRREGQFEKHTVLWPVWSHARYEHPKAAGTAWVLFPLYGRVRLNSQRGWMVLPPFFQHVRGDQLTRTYFPWPFFQRETGVRERLSIWPLYGRRVDAELKRTYWLWPLISREENEQGRGHSVRWTVAPLYNNVSYSRAAPAAPAGASAEDAPAPPREVRANRTKLWPLVSRQYDLDAGAYRLRAPDLWPGPHPPAVERTWAPLWTWVDFRVRGDDSDFEVLWGLYRATRRGGEGRAFSLFPLWRHERAADDSDRRWSVLKGLIAYDRTATTRRVRFLWAGRLRLAAPREAPEPKP